MDTCKYESDIKRILRLLDGNARGGLVKEFTELQTKYKTMCVDVQGLKEIADLQSKSISAFQQYQNAQEILDSYKVQERKDKKKFWYFIVVQAIAVIGLVLTLLLK